MATYSVEFHHQGQVYPLQAPDNQTLLQTGLDAGISLPFSCSAGVCTTCAAQILSGQIEQPDAMGVSPELQTQGYTLLCVAFPRSDLKVATEKEETVYELQFGQFQN